MYAYFPGGIKGEEQVQSLRIFHFLQGQNLKAQGVEELGHLLDHLGGPGMMLLTPLTGGAVEIGEEPQIPCANLDGWSLKGTPQQRRKQRRSMGGKPYS
jgi:hypothetical protein